MDEDHTRSAWPTHSYDNIYYIQKCYESVVRSSQMVDQTRLPPALRHKAHKAVQLRTDTGFVRDRWISHAWHIHVYLKYRIMPSYYLKLSSPPEKISFACLSYLT